MRKVILVTLVTALILTLLAPVAWAGTVTIRYRIYWSGSDPVRVQVIPGPASASLLILQPGEGMPGNVPATSGLDYGSYGSQVAELEEQLQALGYAPGSVDKFYSRQTHQAIREFQLDYDLEVTGRADAATLRALEEAYAAREAETRGVDPVSADLTSDEALMLQLLNAERVQEGLAPLQVDPALVETARQKSRDMVEHNYFGHQSPTYGSPFAMMQAAGVEYRYAAENLAAASDVERAHQALMASPGHRANILNPKFTRVGIGIADGSSYGMIFTQHFAGY